MTVTPRSIPAKPNTVQLVIPQPRPRGGIARADAGCEPYLKRCWYNHP
jgi:hypothetical protein